MNEKTAIIYPGSKIAPSAYIGHFSIIGSPEAGRSFGSDMEGSSEQHWLPSRGVTIAERVTVGAHVVIGDGTIIHQGASIEDGVSIGHNTVIGKHVEAYFRCQIFNRVIIGEQAWIAGFICNDAQIGARSVVFGSLIHRFVDAVRGEPEAAPILEEEVFIGMGAIIIGGVRVAKGAYIAAGSILTEDAISNGLYVGAPAKYKGIAPQPFRDENARRMTASSGQ